MGQESMPTQLASLVLIGYSCPSCRNSCRLLLDSFVRASRDLLSNAMFVFNFHGSKRPCQCCLPCLLKLAAAVSAVAGHCLAALPGKSTSAVAGTQEHNGGGGLLLGPSIMTLLGVLLTYICCSCLSNCRVLLGSFATKTPISSGRHIRAQWVWRAAVGYHSVLCLLPSMLIYIGCRCLIKCKLLRGDFAGGLRISSGRNVRAQWVCRSVVGAKLSEFATYLAYQHWLHLPPQLQAVALRLCQRSGHQQWRTWEHSGSGGLKI